MKQDDFDDDFDLQCFIKSIGKSYLPRELLTCDGTLVRML